MSLLLPGTQVEARGLPWEVVHAEPAGEQQRLRLWCLQGMETDLLHPFEPIRPMATDFDPRRAGRLRQWLLYHDAFLLEQALGPSALLAAQPGRLDIAPYQLVPVKRALRMSRPRLLLAVVLGKTIEAGLVMAEFIARQRAHRILIVSTAGPLLEQWHREMRKRFGLRFEAIRSAGELQEIQRSLGPLLDRVERAAEPEPVALATKAVSFTSLSTVDGTLDILLRLLVERGVITSGDAQEATGLDAAGVWPLLKRLVEEGRAVTEGQRRGMKYRRLTDA